MYYFLRATGSQGMQKCSQIRIISDFWEVFLFPLPFHLFFSFLK